MDGIRVVLADHDPLVDAGVHILEQMRQLFDDLAPRSVLIEMNVASASTMPDEQRLPSVPVSPRVIALHDDQHRVFVFGVLTGESAPELTKQTALQTIREAMEADSGGVGDRHTHRSNVRATTPHPSSTPVAIPDSNGTRNADLATTHHRKNQPGHRPAPRHQRMDGPVLP